MSKVVKKVGRAISNVVKGAVKVVKKVASSKIGKVLITAAAVYFGGAALAGGFSSSAAGGSFLSGMGTGLSNAAASLGQAWTSVLSGNLSGAGSAISSGFQGLNAAQAAGTAAQAVGTAAEAAGAFSGATSTGLPTVAGDAANVLTNKSGLVSGILNGMGDRSKAALITGGSQLVGGVIQGIGQQKAVEEQRAAEQQAIAEQRARYDNSVQQYLQQANSGVQPGGEYVPQGPNYDPVLEARNLAAKYGAMAGAVPQLRPGVINSQMPGWGTTNNNFPIYNPAYYRG